MAKWPQRHKQLSTLSILMCFLFTVCLQDAEMFSLVKNGFFVLHSWAWVGLKNRFTMAHWSFDSQHWQAKPMSLSWAPKDMQACYGESIAPLNSNPTLECAVPYVVDVNDVYMLLSRLVGHTVGISKLQAFLDLWCWCQGAVGYILKLSLQGRPPKHPMLEVFNNTDSLVRGEGWRDWAVVVLWGRRTVQTGGRELWESPACSSCSGVDAWCKDKDPSSRCWSCKAKEQTQFLRPVPPAEQITGLLFSTGHGPSQLPFLPSSSPVLHPVLWKTARLISFSTDLLRHEVLVPSMIQNWWMWERIFTFTSTEVMAFWDDHRKKKNKRAQPAQSFLSYS